MRQLLVIVFAFVLSAIMPLQHFESSAHQASTAQEQNAPKTSEKVYSSDEVDKAAVIKNINSVLSVFESRMHCKGEGITTISVVLRKTRKVTDIKVETTTQCKIPAGAIAALRKIKFTPALKSGKSVSQLYELDMKQELHAMPNPQGSSTR